MKLETYLSITLAFILSMLAFTALADDIDAKNLSLGIGWDIADTAGEKYNSLLMRAGYDLNDNLTIEGEASFSFSSSGDVSEVVENTKFSGYGIYANEHFQSAINSRYTDAWVTLMRDLPELESLTNWLLVWTEIPQLPRKSRQEFQTLAQDSHTV